MKKTMLLVAILTFVSKTTGFLRDITLSFFWGASCISDAYLVALTLPSIIFAFVGMALDTSFIPIYTSLLNDHGRARADRFMNNLVNMLLLASALMILFSLVAAKQAVTLLAMGFTGETFETAVFYSRICAAGLVFTGMNYVFTGYLQSHKSFVVPVLAGIPFNVVTILFMVLGAYYNQLLLPLGSVAALGVQFLLTATAAVKMGYRYQPLLDRSDPSLKAMGKMFIPLLLGVSVNQINILVDKTIASQIVVGGISALNYANKLNLFIQGVFVLSISTVLYPQIAKFSAEKALGSMSIAVSEALVCMSLLVIPAATGAMIFSEPFVQILFGRGAFSGEAIHLTAGVLFCLAMGMLAFGFMEILSKIFYALHDTRTPMINASIALLVNIALNMILPRFMGLNGVALSTTLAAYFSVALMAWSLKKKTGYFGLQATWWVVSKITVASAIMGACAWITYRLLAGCYASGVALLAAVSIGAAVYVLLVAQMRIRDVDHMIQALKHRFGYAQL